MEITLKVAAIIRNNKQQTLLIKEKYSEQEGYKWNLVKGTFDHANETIEDCIKREINEEVGLTTFESVALNKVFHYGNEDKPKILFVFNVFCISNEMTTTKNNKSDENISEIKWFTNSELLNLSEKDCMAAYVYKTIRNSSEKVLIDKI